jgi:hypothetical protein
MNYEGPLYAMLPILLLLSLSLLDPNIPLSTPQSALP